MNLLLTSIEKLLRESLTRTSRIPDAQVKPWTPARWAHCLGFSVRVRVLFTSTLIIELLLLLVSANGTLLRRRKPFGTLVQKPPNHVLDWSSRCCFAGRGLSFKGAFISQTPAGRALESSPRPAPTGRGEAGTSSRLVSHDRLPARVCC